MGIPSHAWRLAALAVVSAGWVCGQDPVPLKPTGFAPPPKAHCDSFSLTNMPRLDFEQKACYYSEQLFTGSAVFGAAFFGAIAMAQHDPPEWPQGAQGFGDRFGTRYTQGMVKSTATFLAGAALHEDPRPRIPYDEACSEHRHIPHAKYWARLGDSLLRVVWTHNDLKCADRVAFSRLAGSLAGGFVERAWLPASKNTVGNALLSSASGLGGYAANSVFTEFQADLFGFVGKMFGTGKPKPIQVVAPSAAPKTGASQ